MAELKQSTAYKSEKDSFESESFSSELRTNSKSSTLIKFYHNTEQELSLLSQRVVTPEQIARHPKAYSSSAKGFHKLTRKVLAKFDHSWDSPKDLKQGGVRVSKDARLALEVKPYRSLKKLSNDQKKELSAIREEAVQEKVSNYSVLYRHRVPIESLPAALNKFRILHLTDIHFRENDTRAIRELDSLTEYLKKHRERVDLLAITGDIISGHPKDLTPSALKALSNLLDVLKDIPCLFVAGNHDYYPGQTQNGVPAIDVVKNTLGKFGIIDITSKQVCLKIQGEELNILGIDDYTEGCPIPPVKNSAILKKPSILLVHDINAVRADCTKVDLILSGHTHWGELRVPGVIDGTYLMKVRGFCDGYNDQVRGWDRLTERTLSYVGAGSARHSFWNPLAKPGAALLELVDREEFRTWD